MGGIKATSFPSQAHRSLCPPTCRIVVLNLSTKFSLVMEIPGDVFFAVNGEITEFYKPVIIYLSIIIGV